MTARVLTDDEYDRHMRIGVALGVSPEALRNEPRDQLIHTRAVTDLEPCESCGARVIAVEENGAVSVVEPYGPPECRPNAGGWWQDVVAHTCRPVRDRSHLAVMEIAR